MKKLIALMMALAMIAAFAACGNTQDDVKDTTGAAGQTTDADLGETNDETTGPIAGGPLEDETQPDVEDTTTANDIMDDVWGQIPEDQKPMVIGGHYSAEFTGAPNTYELAYADELAGTLLIPEAQIDFVTDASTAVHMMNANTMTVGMVKLAEGTDMQAFADAVYGRITGNQWMCGFPEKLIVSQVHEDYVLIAYGATALLDSFETVLDARWETSDFYNEAMQ